MYWGLIVCQTSLDRGKGRGGVSAPVLQPAEHKADRDSGLGFRKGGIDVALWFECASPRNHQKDLPSAEKVANIKN